MSGILMSGTLSVEPLTITERMKRGDEKSVTVSLTNDSDELLGFHGEVEASDPNGPWVSLEYDSLGLEKGESREVTLTLQVPKQTRCRRHLLKVQFTAETEPPDTTDLLVEIDLPPAWQCWLQQHYKWLVVVVVALIVAALLWTQYSSGSTGQTPTPVATSIATPEASNADAAAAPTAEPITGTVRNFANIPFFHVPAGKFRMGPAKQVVDLTGYWIMQTEVTNAQYSLCGTCTSPQVFTETVPSEPNHPVVGVSWEQANTYAQSIGGRLPTNAEWEKVCRGTVGRAYPWGEEAPIPLAASPRLNYRGIYPTGALKVSLPVGRFESGASPYGALDMLGNVWEWTSSKSQNQFGNDVLAYRGGAFDSGSGTCVGPIGAKASTTQQYNIGFRVVRDPQSGS